MKLIIRKIKNIVKLNNKYHFTYMAASTSFYCIVAAFSVFSLLLQLYNSFFINEKNFIINKIFDLINPVYYEYFENLVPILSINSFSNVLLISLIWSSSRIISGYNKVSDLIYVCEKKRNYIVNRISSFFFFCVFFLIVVFGFVSVIFASKLVKKIINNLFLYYLIQFSIEIILVYLLMCVLYIYLPPKKMKFKEVNFNSFLVSVFIYIFTNGIIWLFTFIQNINPKFGISSIFSLFFLWVYIINLIIVFGIYLNYISNKHH